MTRKCNKGRGAIFGRRTIDILTYCIQNPNASVFEMKKQGDY